jgi:hypothetical protein
VHPPLNVEDFMRLFLAERTVTLKRRLEVHQKYWRKFHLPDVQFDSRCNSLAEAESEKIVEISERQPNGIVQVITRNCSKGHRYHLESVGERWIIQRVDYECVCTAIALKRDCEHCSGSGWRRQTDSVKLPPRKVVPLLKKVVQLLNASKRSCDPTVELFFSPNAGGTSDFSTSGKRSRSRTCPPLLWAGSYLAPMAGR